MILPMMGFVFGLIALGALATLVALAAPAITRSAPYVGFGCLFAGLGALALSMGLGGLGEAADRHFRTMVFGAVGFFGGYTLGGLSGALLGLMAAVRRNKRSKLP